MNLPKLPKIKIPKIITNTKAIARTVLAVKVISTTAKVGATVYSLIPKYDKIENVDTESLIDNLAPAEMTAEEVVLERERSNTMHNS